MRHPTISAGSLALGQTIRIKIWERAKICERAMRDSLMCLTESVAAPRKGCGCEVCIQFLGITQLMNRGHTVDHFHLDCPACRRLVDLREELHKKSIQRRWMRAKTAKRKRS